MPLLAHILAPQIMARAREIEEQLGPPTVELGPAEVRPAPGATLGPAEVRPAPGVELGPAEVRPTRAAGYLGQQNIGFEKTPYDPRGLIDKPEPKNLSKMNPNPNPKTPQGATAIMLGALQRSGDPRLQKVATAFLEGSAGKVLGRQGMYRPPQAGQTVDAKGKAPSYTMLMPMPGASEPIGFTESGEPIYEPVTPRAPKRTGVVKLNAGAPVGFDEAGQSVDRRGKKLGYLQSTDAPYGTVMGPGREMPMRDLARRATDAPMDKRDAFGATALQRLYAPHLKAMQDHFQDTGKETFPPGYFNGMSKQKRKEIEEGVEALRDMEKGTQT